MSDLDIYVFLVVPTSMILLCVLALIAQYLADKRVQKHVDRLVKLQAERTEVRS